MGCAHSSLSSKPHSNKRTNNHVHTMGTRESSVVEERHLTTLASLPTGNLRLGWWRVWRRRAQWEQGSG